MAIKERECNPKYKGLRGVWTNLTEKSALTDQSYPSAVKKASLNGAGYLGGGALVLGAIFSVIIPVAEWSDVSIDNAAIDYSIIQNGDHVGFEDQSGKNWILFRSEAGQGVFDNDPSNDVWRLYSVDKEDRDESAKYLLTLEDNSQTVSAILTYASEEVSLAQQNVEDGLYVDHSDYYTLTSVSGRFEEKIASGPFGINVVDIEIMRAYKGGTTQTQFEIGDNLREEYAELSGLFTDAAEAMNNGQFAGIHAELSPTIDRSNVYFGWDDAFTVWGVALVFALSGAAIGGVAGAPIGAVSEKVSRNVQRRRKKKEKQERPG